MSMRPVPDPMGGTEVDQERALPSVSQLHFSVDSKANSPKSGLTRPLFALYPLS